VSKYYYFPLSAMTMLCIPVGSADAERGFAIMNNIVTSKRSSMEHDTLDAIMRIKINGPPIEKFNAMKYAKKWEQSGGVLSDDSRNFGKTKTDDKKFLDDSNLF